MKLPNQQQIYLPIIESKDNQIILEKKIIIKEENVALLIDKLNYSQDVHLKDCIVKKSKLRNDETKLDMLLEDVKKLNFSTNSSNSQFKDTGLLSAV